MKAQKRPHRYNWIKLWTNEFFDSTLRIELTNNQRGIWIDLLALAGRSRFVGTIAPGTDSAGNLSGYPVRILVAMMISWTDAELSDAFGILESTGRIKIENRKTATGEDGLIIKIVQWEKYQSESARIAKWRHDQKKKKHSDRNGAQPKQDSDPQKEAARQRKEFNRVAGKKVF